VRSPLGFGKKYFTFSSVLAHSVQSTLESQVCRTHSLLQQQYSDEEALLDEDPPTEILEVIVALNTKPCHCNCFFKVKTRLALLLNTFIPRCPYYTTCFAFRRTGVHPPLVLS
jgi:hypothetical protein